MLAMAAGEASPACLGFQKPRRNTELEIAGQIAVLDLVSQGRAYLGLARGSWLTTIGVETPRPVCVKELDSYWACAVKEITAKAGSKSLRISFNRLFGLR